MATASVTYTFAPDTTIFSGEVNTNFSDLVTLLNNYNSGSSEWANVFITSTATTPLKVSGNQSSTVVSIDNTASDGDPALAFLLSGVEVGRMFVDDSDSDRFKINMNTRVEKSSSGADVLLKTSNTSDTASSTSTITSEVAGTSAGDAMFQAIVSGAKTFTWGIDNSASDAWVLCEGTTLGTNNAISVSATSAAVTIRGTTTNDAAATGFVGETVKGSTLFASRIALSTGTAANIASVALTAGDWDISGAIGFIQSGTTNITGLLASISATSATVPANSTFCVPNSSGEYRTERDFGSSGFVPAGNFIIDLAIPRYRVSLSGSATLYLVARSSFTVSANEAFGFIEARRMR